MSKLISIVFVFLFATVSGQITVDKTYMPSAGDKINYTVANNNNSKEYEKKGTQVTWDYSDLTLAFQEMEDYKSARSINFFFFGMDYGIKVADSLGFGQFMMRDIYDVYDVKNSFLLASGRSLRYNGIPIPQNYSDKDEIYQFPLMYGDIDTSSYKVAFSLGGQLSLIQNGQRINNVEGWGELVLPHRTYPKCIKVKTTINSSDTLKIAGIQLPPIPRTTVEYKWFAEGVKNPVLLISGALLGSNFTRSRIQYQEKPVDFVGFWAEDTSLIVESTTNLHDTSKMSGIFRNWQITPETYELKGGSNLGDSLLMVSFTEPGLYTVSLTKRNRFGAKTVTKTDYIEVEEKPIDNTSLLEFNDENQGVVFPNPFKSKIALSGVQVNAMRLIDMAGRVLVQSKSNELNQLQDLEAGVYFLEWELPNGSISGTKVVKH